MSILHLNVPDIPPTPLFTIDYVNEITVEPVSDLVQYSTKSDFSSYGTGSGTNLNLVPGVSLYFRQPATSSSFESGVSHLVVPFRPVITSSETDSTRNDTIRINIIFGSTISGFSADDIMVTNGTAVNLQPEFSADIVPSQTGMVTVKVPADVIDGGNFVSNTISVKYIGGMTDINDISGVTLRLYPNPSEGKVWFDMPAGVDLSQITFEVYNNKGQLVKSVDNFQENCINLSDQPEGIYYLKISGKTHIRTEAIILK